MPDRLIVWLVALAPLLTVLGAAAHARWKKQAPGRRLREMAVAGGVLLLLAAWGLGPWVWSALRGLKGPGGPVDATRIHFQHPLYLLWLLPLYALLLLLQWKTLAGLSRGRQWLAFLLRSSLLALLGLALAGLQAFVEKDTLTVLFAIDRSKSVPAAEAQSAVEFIRAAVPAKYADDKVGLVAFGGKAACEVLPKEVFACPDVAHFKSEIQPDATNIAEAARTARNSFEETSGKRLILFTDGRENAGAGVEELKQLKSQGVDVWVVPLRRSEAAEMLVEKVEVTNNRPLWEQPVEALVKIRSNVSGKARLRLFTGDRVGPAVYERIVDVESGKNAPVRIPLRLRTGGWHEIKAVLEPLSSRDDTLKENNEAYTFADVQTDCRVLVLTSDLAEVEHLRKALEGEKLTLDVRSGASLPENPEEYRRYDCIVLANLARAFLSEQQMAVLESCVKDQGAGLVMIGGDQSFGAGEYLNTPVERALPVSMELKNQKIMPSGALGIVLHTCEFGDGNAWGKKIAKAAINVLSPQDYAGLIYYGNMGGETWLFRPTLVSRKPWMFGLIDGCNPGDMPSLDTIVSMAVQSLANLRNVSLKHCIMITDGDPQKPSPQTMAAAKNAKVTLTIVTIAPHSGMDVSDLKAIAQELGGRYYNADDPRKLPQIFIKEAAVVRKSLIYSDDKGIPVTLGSPGEVLREFGKDFPAVRAFVVTQHKDRAEMHLYTTVEGEKVPILSRWHYGLGKSVAFTSDATNRWAPQWISWASYKKIWTNLIHWVSRRQMSPNYTVNVLPAEKGVSKVVVEGIDAKGEYLNNAKFIGVATDPGLGGEDLDAGSSLLNFSQTAPGRYEAQFPARKQGSYTVTVTEMSNPAQPSSIVTGLANSYSREFMTLDDSEKGLLDLGAAAGEGKLKNLAELAKDPRRGGIFNHDLPPVSNPADLFWPLLVAALCLFPLDVAVRRLHVEPKAVADWAGARLAPVFAYVRTKGGAVADAVAEAARSTAPSVPPPLMPTGEESRAAQSRYEQAGSSAEAQALDLKAPPGGPAKPAAVGGAKLTPADSAASDYTRALLRAKKRAKKE